MKQLMIYLTTALISGALLALVDLFIPSLSALAAFVIGWAIFFRIFMVPGHLTWRRDVGLFSIMLGMIATDLIIYTGTCTFLVDNCQALSLSATALKNGACSLLPVLFFWSFIRLRVLKHRATKERKEEIIQF